MHQDPAARLRRMQRLNLALLAVLLLLLAVSVRYQAQWPWLRWLQAFAEAAAIGAIADWYAVVALFRHPLRLPVPHTAIIPRKQRGIGASLGRFVARYLLTPDTITARLARFESARRLIEWLGTPANAAACAASLTGQLPSLLRAPDDADLRRLFQQIVLPQIAAVDAAGLARRCIDLLLDTGLQAALLDRALKPLERWLTDNEILIREKFGAASRYTPAFVDSYIVRKFVEGIRALIHDVGADPQHELRGSLEQALRAWSRGLERSPQQRAALQVWVRNLVEALAADQDLQRLREALARSIERDLARPHSIVRNSTAEFIAALAQGVRRDPVILLRLEQAWLQLARTQAERHGGQIAALISEVVGGWNSAEVVRRIELEIGPDLQFIRINGALVGGLAGVLLYAGTVLMGRR